MKISIRFLLGLALAVGLFAVTASSAKAYVGISIGIAPPPLPVVYQPDCPGDGYMWTPGYWALDPDADSYYWVPGSWVIAPEVGLLWTPCWWGWQDGAYCFHDGYWGRSVGFYGGVNYGYGYFGRGYDGGRWNGGHFYYNRNANNLRGISSTRTFAGTRGFSGGSRVSFNGGSGGVRATATASELRASRVAGATATQRSLAISARTNPGQRFSTNHGTPAATGTRNGSLSSAGNANLRQNQVAGDNRTRTTGGDSAFTGGDNRTRTQSGGSALAGGQTQTNTRHVSGGSPVTQNHTANVTPAVRHVAQSPAPVVRSGGGSVYQPERHVSAPRVSNEPSRAPSFHPSGGSNFSHAPVSHSGGGNFSGGSRGGGGGGASHASASSGGGHSNGGGGGHSGGGGGGNNHH